MTNLNKLKYLKGLQLNISQIQINLSKSAMMEIIQGILVSEDNASLLRAIQPHIPEFPQFPEHTNASIQSVQSDGAATIVLKVPTNRSTPKADEPATEAEPTVEPEPTDTPDVFEE